MLELIKGCVGETAAPFVFLAAFLAIGGGALWATPRLAKWLDGRRKQQPGYYDGMMTEDPEKKEPQEEKSGHEQAD